MASEKLAAALASVDWNDNVQAFIDDKATSQKLAKANLRLAQWARQLENVDRNNPAMCFVREMQIASQHVAVLTALGLYKPAAGSMRTMLETALYYTYFRTHHSELATLVRDPVFYVEKREIVDYHRKHTPGFGDLQGRLGLLVRLEQWYSTVSAIVHGQIPGTWIEHNAVAEIKRIPATEEVVIKAFIEGEGIAHSLFLCTVGRVLWDGFSSTAKKQLLSGLRGDVKEALGLDSA